MVNQVVNSSLNALKAAQKKMDIHAQNIFNADDPNYSRMVPETTHHGDYISVQGIRKADEFLFKNIILSQSPKTKVEKMIEYFDLVKSYFGEIDSLSNPNKAIEALQTSLGNLCQDVKNISSKQAFVSSADQMTRLFREFTGSVYDLRLRADREIESSYTHINSTLKELFEMNKAVYSDLRTGIEIDNKMQNKRDALIKTLSQYLDIEAKFGADNFAYISVKSNGTTLLSNDFYGQFQYNAQSDSEKIINQQAFEAVKIGSYDTDDNKISENTFIRSKSSTFYQKEETIQQGSLKALYDLRDSDLSKIIDVTDNLAKNLAKELNAIHNKGTGYPPLTEYIGTRPVTLNEVHAWEGKFRIAALDEYGKSVTRGDGSDFSPLDLDLGILQANNATGQVDVKTLIKEINEYFYYAPTTHATKLGNIRDIKMVGMQDISAGQFSFDMELDNKSQFDTIYKLTDIQVFDNLGVALPAGAVTNADMPEDFLITAASRERTNQTIGIDFTQGGGGAGGPFTIKVNMRTMSAQGEKSSIVEFIVDNTDSTTLNQRFASNAASNDGQIVAAQATNGFMKAMLVREDGTEITENNESGYLRFVSVKDSDYTVAFEDKNTKELGRVSNSIKYNATNCGLAHFFGMNNLFVETYDSINYASRMKVREDILENPATVTTGKLSQDARIMSSMQTYGTVAASGSVLFSANLQNNDIIDINGTNFTFKAAAVTDSEVQIGLTLQETIDNLVEKLSANNSTTLPQASKATYTTLGNDTLSIDYKALGTAGNAFNISVNLSVATASINEGIAAINANATLIDGADRTEQFQETKYTYSIGESANEAAVEALETFTQPINFKTIAGVATSKTTFVGYATQLISFTASKYNNLESELGSVTEQFQAFRDRYQSSLRPDRDIELMGLVEARNSAAAIGKVLSTGTELFNIVLKALDNA